MIQTSRAHQAAMPQKAAASEVYVARAGARRGVLPTLVARMIELFDGTRTVAEVCGEVQISAARGLAVVRKLTADGCLLRIEADLGRADTLRDLTPLPAGLGAPNADPAASSGFTAEEEAFFASEVAPTDEWDAPLLTVRERIGLALASLLHIHEPA